MHFSFFDFLTDSSENTSRPSSNENMSITSDKSIHSVSPPNAVVNQAFGNESSSQEGIIKILHRYYLTILTSEAQIANNPVKTENLNAKAWEMVTAYIHSNQNKENQAASFIKKTFKDHDNKQAQQHHQQQQQHHQQQQNQQHQQLQIKQQPPEEMQQLSPPVLHIQEYSVPAVHMQDHTPQIIHIQENSPPILHIQDHPQEIVVQEHKPTQQHHILQQQQMYHPYHHELTAPQSFTISLATPQQDENYAVPVQNGNLGNLVVNGSVVNNENIGTIGNLVNVNLNAPGANVQTVEQGIFPNSPSISMHVPK